MTDNINFISASSLPEATGEAVDVICIENGEMKKKSGAALGGGGVSSWNDLTDKPFGEEVVVYGDTVTWDGNTEGHVVVEIPNEVVMFVKISDVIPTLDDCKDGITEVFSDGTVYEWTYQELSETFYPQAGILCTESSYFIPNDNFDFMGMVTLPEAGVYVIYHPEYGHVASITIPNYNGFETKSISKITKEYLPEGYPYAEKKEETFTYDGDITGKETVQMGEGAWLVKVSDNAPEMADLVGKTVAVYMNGEDSEHTITSEMIFSLADEGIPAYTVLIEDAQVIYGFSDDVNDSGLSVPKGFYLFHMEEDSTVLYTKSLSLSTETIHKLDNKFLDTEWMASTSIVRTTIIPEATVDTSSGETNFADVVALAEGISVEDFKDGAKMFVTFNGEEYEVEIYSGTMGTMKAVCIGNWSFLGVNTDGRVPSNVPFCVYALFENEVLNDGRLCLEENHGLSSVTFKVDGDIVVYNKLPDEYLPERVLKCYYNFSVDIADCYEPSTESDGYVFTAEALKEIRNAMTAITDGRIVMGTCNGIPCIITKAVYDTMDYQHYIRYATLSELTSFTNYSTKRLQGKKELILASSTEGSEKQFKITVDDNGTITATEIV